MIPPSPPCPPTFWPLTADGAVADRPTAHIIHTQAMQAIQLMVHGQEGTECVLKPPGCHVLGCLSPILMATLQRIEERCQSMVELVDHTPSPPSISPPPPFDPPVADRPSPGPSLLYSCMTLKSYHTWAIKGVLGKQQ